MPIPFFTLREDAQTAEMELIAAQYRGRARVLQAKLFVLQSNNAVACSLGKALHASFPAFALSLRSLLRPKTEIIYYASHQVLFDRELMLWKVLQRLWQNQR